MGSKPSTALAATVVAVALASFPAGAAAVKDYSQNSVNGEAAAPLPAELLKDYSMNAATGDYAPPIHHARPTRVGRIRGSDEPSGDQGYVARSAQTAPSEREGLELEHDGVVGKERQ